jgi:hypothetical protein
MENDSVFVETARQLSGQNVRAAWVRPMKVRKGAQPLFKETHAIVRCGIAYDNRAIVIEGRENGDLPAENAGLSGKEWVEFPFLLRSVKSGELSIRLTPNSFGIIPKVRYLTPDGEVTKEIAVAACLASEFPKTPKEPPLALDVPLRYFTLLHRAEAEKIAQ